MQQEKDQREKKRKYLGPKKHDEFKKKEASRIKEYLLKKKLAEQFACDSQKETEEERPSTSSSFSSKQILNRSIKKTERSLPLSPRKKSRSHRQPCQEIQIKDNNGRKQSRKEDERIESGGKRVARELFRKSRYNLHKAWEAQYRLCRNRSG